MGAAAPSRARGDKAKLGCRVMSPAREPVTHKNGRPAQRKPCTAIRHRRIASRVLFVFDAVKDASNRAKHGVPLALAEYVFLGPHVTIRDQCFDYGREQQIAFGRLQGRRFACGYVDRGGERPVISLRKADDRNRVDAFGASDIARQLAADPDTAPEIDVRAIRLATGLSQAQFAAAYEFSLRTVQESERGAKRPSGPARTLPKAIKNAPDARRRAIAAA